ncbi:MAG: ankyrin repeat domain-containing protein [Pseudomonadota bacterium]
MTKAPAEPGVPPLSDVRKSAKALLRALRAGDAKAFQRLKANHPRNHAIPREGPFHLHQALLVIARESGFASWPRLKDWYDKNNGQVARLEVFQTDPAYFRDRATGLGSMLETGESRARDQVRAHHPRYRSLEDNDPAWGVIGPDDLALVVAGQHGFPGWAELEAHLADVAANRADSPFRNAFQALENTDIGALNAALAATPDLLDRSGTNGNTLLNLASALLVTPNLSRPPGERNTAEDARFAMVDRLIAAGADPDRANHKGWTPLHQAAYSDNTPLARRLVEAGATIDLEAYDSGGTPLTVALWWGHQDVSAYLAGLAITPDNLRVNAGLGRLDRMAELFDATGRPTPEAGRKRGFHRPHSGFPPWQPTPGHVQEILDDAFSFAARSGRVDAMAFLKEKGADVNGVACNGSPLQWAVSQRKPDAVRWLVANGADVNLKTDFARNYGQTALHSAAFSGQPEMIDVLVGAGGELSVRDDAYDSSPLGWALHLDRPAVAEHIVTSHWQACNAEDLIVAGAPLDRIATRIELDPLQREGSAGTGTPLRAAASLGREDVVRLLLSAGADAESRNRDGLTAADLARQAGHDTIVALFEAD